MIKLPAILVTGIVNTTSTSIGVEDEGSHEVVGKDYINTKNQLVPFLSPHVTQSS